MDRRAFLRQTAVVGMVGLASTAAAATAVGCAPPGGGPVPGRPAHRGGANYGWWGLDGCDREPFGVVRTFHQNAEVIRSQLRDMYQQGQSRLRILLYHRRGPDSGTLLDSTGGDLSVQNRRNLADLLTAVAEAGFVEIQVSFLPQGRNVPYLWPRWDEDLYQENWNLIVNLRPLLVDAGILYRIDLCNEAIPAPSQPVLLEYAQRLWTDYTHVFGRDDTLGFSAIASADRVARIPDVYGTEPPHLFDFHFYGNTWDGRDEHRQFVDTHQAMAAMGYGVQGWTIGEVYYDDQAAAEGLRRAIDETGRTVHYLLEWPLRRGAACEHVSVAPPLSFAAYSARGF